MPNERKIQIVKNLKESLSKAKGLVLTDYHGLSVPEVEVLRRSLQEVGANYQIVKNTLLKLALKDSDFRLPTSDFRLAGPSAIVLSCKDEIEPIKAIYDFAKEHEALKIKGGFFEEGWTAPEKLKKIALLPNREELLSRLIGMTQSPIVRLVSVGKSNQTALVKILKAKAGDSNG